MSPEVVFPDAATGTGTLPYSTTFSIRKRDGTVLVQVAGRLWKSSESVSDGGMQTNYSGVCGAAAAEHVVDKQNRVLVADGIEYRVGDATYYPTLKYVELDLTRVLPNG